MVMDTECVDVKAPKDPTVTKKVDPDTISNGDQITYYIIIENPSNPIALEYDIDDTLPAGFSYNSLVSVMESLKCCKFRNGFWSAIAA